MRGRILLLGGTTEGRVLADELARQGWEVTVCVATEYGAELLQGLPVTVRTGRMDEGAMVRCFPAYDQVVDATHPYAVEVSRNARAAAARCGVRYRRLIRPQDGESAWWKSVPDMASAVAALEGTRGNILLTTGSKDLSAFAGLTDYRERLWVRILASPASLTAALAAGIPSSHIVAMQGPFSVELNVALLRQFAIRTLVTKRSGRAGGFAEKVEAARRTQTALLVVERPQAETGETLEQLLQSFARGENLL